MDKNTNPELNPEEMQRVTGGSYEEYSPEHQARIKELEQKFYREEISYPEFLAELDAIREMYE